MRTQDNVISNLIVTTDQNLNFLMPDFSLAFSYSSSHIYVENVKAQHSMNKMRNVKNQGTKVNQTSYMSIIFPLFHHATHSVQGYAHDDSVSVLTREHIQNFHSFGLKELRIIQSRP